MLKSLLACIYSYRNPDDTSELKNKQVKSIVWEDPYTPVTFHELYYYFSY